MSYYRVIFIEFLMPNMRMANKWLRDFERPIFRLKNHEIKKTGQITFKELKEPSLPKPIIRIAREVT